LINNLLLHESLSRDAGDAASDAPPTAIDRARTAAEAVRLPFAPGTAAAALSIGWSNPSQPTLVLPDVSGTKAPLV